MSDLKLLFVSHVVTLGGASRSLRELVGAYDGATIDLAVPRFANAPSDAHIRDFFGPNLRRILRFWLPWSEVYVGHPTVRQSARSHLLFPLAWRAQRPLFERFVQREGYDDVHLNSLVLHPMLSERIPMTMHVREILVEQHDRVQADAARARGVVFIDEATRKPFEPRVPARHIVLNNPVNMTAVGTPPADIEARLRGDPAALTVFAMIGDLTDEKGVPFVIDAFKRVKSPRARLLLVGKGDASRFAGHGDSRIVFWGEERDMAGIYTVADYVLRGEGYPCVGRTIYEALYAGGGVLVPGTAASHGMFEFERFASRIHFYPPRDEAAFVKLVEQLAPHKHSEKRGDSNVTGYVAEFDRFVRAAVGKG